MVSIWKLLLPLGVDLLPFKICNACGCFCLLAVWLSFSFCLSLLFFSLPTIHKPPFPLPTGPITPVFCFVFFLLFYPDFNTYFLFHLLTHKYTLTHTIRWRLGAQWRFSSKALLHVLNAPWDSVEEQGWGSAFIFCSATGRWRHPVETKASRGGGRNLKKRSFVGKDTVCEFH